MNKTAKKILLVFSIIAVLCAMWFIVKFMLRSFETALAFYWVTIALTAAVTYSISKNKYKNLAEIAVGLKKGRINAACVNNAKDETKCNLVYFYAVNSEKELLSITSIDCPYTFSKMMSNYSLQDKYKKMVDYLNTGNDYTKSDGRFIVVDKSYDEFFDKTTKNFILDDY